MGVKVTKQRPSGAAVGLHGGVDPLSVEGNGAVHGVGALARVCQYRNCSLIDRIVDTEDVLRIIRSDRNLLNDRFDPWIRLSLPFEKYTYTDTDA